MNVSVIESDYIGTTFTACLVEMGHNVVNTDLDESINADECPERDELDVYEGLCS